ncbi:MAG: class I SAM-dependent methyltransferase [Desulfobacteraceae bacterium]|nr:MAG: class I SAM-dependent methyltransferase [Desulfobacteraceae bacterium]
MSSKSAEHDIVKKTEAETLATFQQEIPSQYFSHMGDPEYKRHVENAEYLYRDLLKFPPKMFDSASLIDFGAGTGENTIYFANWGARCTLVEMNDKAHNISKEVFSRYARNKDLHKFVCSSIFDYSPNDGKEYDIVHCRGVLSHTAANKRAFKKVSTFVKPGGFLIYSDPNKAGGFQNMLQRFAVYHFATTPEEMVQVCEKLFKEDIDRSQKAVPRTRRAIIFDRWVIQSQDDPSVSEVAAWGQESGLRLYSSHPPVLLPFFGDSLHHRPKTDPYSFHELFSIAELTWMMQTESDAEFLPKITAQMSHFAGSLSKLSSHVQNFNVHKAPLGSEFAELSRSLVSSFNKLDLLSPLRNKLAVFASEAEAFVKVVNDGRLEQVRKFIENSKYLFKGACGMRLGLFILYKPVQTL